MIFTWLPMDLPRPPEKFITLATELGHKISNNHSDIDNTALNQGDSEYANRWLIKDGKKIKSRIQFGYDLGDEWKAWVKENIIEDFYATGGRYSYGKDTTTHGAHSDAVVENTAIYKLYYILDAGGEDARTVFYQEHGHPLNRKGSWEHICHCDDYSKMDVVEELRIPQGRWVLLNTNILHGVEGVTGTRLNLVVVVTTNNIEQLVLDLYKKFI